MLKVILFGVRAPPRPHNAPTMKPVTKATTQVHHNPFVNAAKDVMRQNEANKPENRYNRKGAVDSLTAQHSHDAPSTRTGAALQSVRH